MEKETVREYTILFQYLLFLKEPTYLFLIQVFHHLSPSHWWENYIEPVLRDENKENFKYLDIADLLNVFKMNWGNIFTYLDKQYHRFKYDNEYKLVGKVHRIRTIVAHANDIDMSPAVFLDSLSCLMNYAKLIHADASLIEKLSTEWLQQRQAMPAKQPQKRPEESLRENILSVIENKVLLNTINHGSLPTDIKFSVDRTMLRFHSMRTIEEIIGFFNNSSRSERGIVVQEALHTAGLLAFEDITDEVNMIYNDGLLSKNS
jgi:hypothetical protein